MRYSKCAGFSLVELMIALLIGLVITLGAGQLFSTGLKSFEKVEELADKQAALMFAADVLIRDIRRADKLEGTDKSISSMEGEFWVELDGVERFYYLDKPDYEERDVWTLYLREDDGSPSPVVEGFRNPNGDPERVSFSAIEDASRKGFYTITFGLISEGEDVVFHAMNRTEAVVGSG